MIVGLGIDLVEIERVRLLVSRQGDRALARLFTDEETAYAFARSDPYRHLAARVAAKEAAFKALAGNERARGIAWKELEVLPALPGPPSLALHGCAAERARELGVSRTWLTLTHTDTTAGAVVVVERS